MPNVGLDLTHDFLFCHISSSESCVYSHGSNRSADVPSSSPHITALAFFNSSSKYPSITKPSVVILINLGLSLRDCDCYIDLPMILFFISWVSSTIAKSILRPSLFRVLSDSLKILDPLDLLIIKR